MKAEWPREHSLTSGQVSHQSLTWEPKRPELHEQKGSSPGKQARSLDPTAATSGSTLSCNLAREDSRGHPRAPNTHQHPEDGAECTLSKLARGSKSRGEQGREGSQREWQHFHKHKLTRISPRMGPKQTSSGPGQESRRAPCPSTA